VDEAAMSTGRSRRGDEPARAEADRAVALSTLALTGARPDACPDPQALASWHERRLAPARALEVEAHVAACDRCFELWRGLAALEAADPRRRPAASRGARWWTALAAAARSPALLGAAAASLAALAVVGGYLTLHAPGLGPPLPAYELNLQGRALLRGAEPAAAAAPIAFTPGTRFELVLRPQTAVSGEVAARVWLEHAGATRPLDAAPAVAARGLLVIAGEIGRDWVLPEGDSDLLVTVGRAQALPDAPVLAQRLGDRRQLETADWVAWRVPVRVGD
jgi:hypothetical protein